MVAVTIVRWFHCRKAGINLAYSLAEMNLKKDGVKRIVPATGGDFEVNITNRAELKSYIERKRKIDIFLSVLGFYMANYNDALMQDLAQNANGTALGHKGVTLFAHAKTAPPFVPVSLFLCQKKKNGIFSPSNHS